MNRQLATLKLRSKIQLWILEKTYKTEKQKRKNSPTNIENMDSV